MVVEMMIVRRMGAGYCWGCEHKMEAAYDIDVKFFRTYMQRLGSIGL